MKSPKETHKLRMERMESWLNTIFRGYTQISSLTPTLKNGTTKIK